MPDSRQGSFTLRAAQELLSSMRFAIALLTVICIASVIGTVLKQQEPLSNYVNQFGPFWSEVFAALGLYAVYSAWWFLLILAFLVISVSLCIARNTPKILRDLKTYKENIREQSLRSFGQHAESRLTGSTQEQGQRIGQLLASGGWKVRLQLRETPEGPGWMVAAKTGAANKLGYIAAHSAVVLICLGGLLDGDLIVRSQIWFNGKVPYAGGGLISDVKPQHRLSERNPTFRGNLVVTEGSQSGTAILSQSDGILLQELPFSIELKKFVVEHYSTGMPKLFASDIVIHDRHTGEAIATRVEVNRPASHRGIEIYQSSFDDGGSSVKLKGLAIKGAAQAFDVEGVIGGSTALTRGVAGPAQDLTLEFVALRVMNIENMGDDAAPGARVQGSLGDVVSARMGAANKPDGNKNLRNVGPSMTYKLRDASGQAHEFHNYMLPMDMGDGRQSFLLGARDKPSDPFRYLRIPVDEEGGIQGFMRLNAALQDPAARALAVQRFVRASVDVSRPELRQPLELSAGRAVELFAGGKENVAGQAGLQAISDFMEANVPQADRDRASEVLIRILNGVLFELAQITREHAGLPRLLPGEKTQAFMTQAVLTLNDLPYYPAPVIFQLTDFKPLQASVFQVARAPGKSVVYLGCALLIVGVFSMLYVRERRLWVWLAPHQGQVHALMALSSNRKTLDGDREFDRLKTQLIQYPDTSARMTS
jgi:cytochrome c biogenesis protein